MTRKRNDSRKRLDSHLAGRRARPKRPSPAPEDASKPIRIVLLNKPFQVMSQFTRPENGRATLADFISEPGIYPAGRLDYDSEGLILLCGDGRLQARISQPRFKMAKTYLIQVDGEIDQQAIERLRAGISLKDGPARAVSAEKIDPPELWPRDPPVRYRAQIPTSWIRLTIDEGRNRQVRRMTAAVDFPTLRLVRERIGPWQLDALQPGESRVETITMAQLVGLPQGKSSPL